MVNSGKISGRGKTDQVGRHPILKALIKAIGTTEKCFQNDLGSEASDSTERIEDATVLKRVSRENRMSWGV
ncbi:hypothetical protein TNCV_4542941 [Trichonephila clavipes]|nr:hypothetical protein TNCV_4542941 [Trichonephila clavipes]